MVKWIAWHSQEAEHGGDHVYRGVFWIVEGELLAFPFREGSSTGMAKSGNTYNHRLLWPYVKPVKCRKSYDYYPRGRIDIDGKGKTVIYLNPNIGEEWIPILCQMFELDKAPVIRYDYSRHYRCWMDD